MKNKKQELILTVTDTPYDSEHMMMIMMTTITSNSPMLVAIESSYTTSYIKTIATGKQVLRIKYEFTNLLQNFHLIVVEYLYRGRRAVPLQMFTTQT